MACKSCQERREALKRMATSPRAWRKEAKFLVRSSRESAARALRLQKGKKA